MQDTGIFKNESLRNRVADHIRREILLGHRFKKGEHLREVELAKRLDISRSTLREALKELEAQGLVCTIPRKGTFISDFDHEDFIEIYRLRYLLETDIYRVLIEQSLLSEYDFKELRKIIDQMVEITDSDLSDQEMFIRFNDLDIAFHCYLWERSGKKWFIQMLKNIFFQLRLAMLQDLILEDNIESSASIHYQIVDALEKGDLEETMKALRKHILVQNIEEDPEYS